MQTRTAPFAAGEEHALGLRAWLTCENARLCSLLWVSESKRSACAPGWRVRTPASACFYSGFVLELFSEYTRIILIFAFCVAECTRSSFRAFVLSEGTFCHTAGLGRPAAPFVARPFVGLSRFKFCRAHELYRDLSRGSRTRLRSGLSAALCAFVDSS